MDDFEREIERELRRALGHVDSAAVPPRRMVRSQRTRVRALVGGAGTALTLKVLSGVAAAAAAVTMAGATTTGSLDPTVWGQQVKAHVADCKAKLADGQHGIGDCVSSFASQHGQDVASAARQHGQENPNAHGGNPNASDHAKDKGKDTTHPTPKGEGGVEPEPSDAVIHGPVRATPLP
jgi:hypothetical protein